MTNQRKPMEFWKTSDGKEHDSENAAFEHCCNMGSVIHFRQLNSQGIDEETVRRVCDWFMEGIGHLKVENHLTVMEMKREFLNATEKS